MEKAVSIIAFINDETDRARTSQLEHDRIHPGDVIGQEEKTAARQLLASNGSDAIDEACDSEGDGIEDAFSGRGMLHHL